MRSFCHVLLLISCVVLLSLPSSFSSPFTYNTITVAWNKTPLALGYKVYLFTEDTLNTWTFSTDKTSFQFTNLTPLGIYSCFVTGTNKAGEGTASSLLKFTNNLIPNIEVTVLILESSNTLNWKTSAFPPLKLEFLNPDVGFYKGQILISNISSRAYLTQPITYENP